MVNPIKSFKKSLREIPSEYRRWLTLGILVALLVALPLSIWGLMTGTFELRKRAATGEPSPLPSAFPSPVPTFAPTPTPLPQPICILSTIVPPTGPAPLTVTLHGGGGAGLTPGIDGYQWDFENDGIWDTGIVAEPIEHVYTQPGTYYPKYRVHSVNGQWSDVCDYGFPIVVSQPSSYGLNLKLRFTGVTSRPNDDSEKRVQIYATSYDGGPDLASESQRLSVVMNVDDNGVYFAEIGLPATYFNHHYRLRVKGPKHLQAVFPDVVFQIDQELDLTAQPLRPGDLNGDKKVDSNDLQLINERIFSNDVNDIEVADVNFDQRVDIIDRTLVLNTLSVYYDPD